MTDPWRSGGVLYRVTPVPRQREVRLILKVTKWDEALHPRDRIGRFAATPSTGASEADLELAEKMRYNADKVNRWWDDLTPEQRSTVRSTVTERAAKAARVNLSETALRGVLESGRFKTLHEVTPDQAGPRRAYEDFAMGTAETPDAHRPIYGYLGDDADLDAYGDYSVVLATTTRTRMSITVGDSMNSTLTPQPLAAVNDLDDDALKGMISGYIMTALGHGAIIDYLEHQIHGGITLADIDAVTVPEDAPADLVTALEKAGIRVEVRESDEPDWAAMLAAALAGNAS